MPKTEVAAIVASGSFLTQTAGSTFTLFTPSANGIFRLTSAPNPTTGSITENKPLWTNGLGSVGLDIATLGGAATFFALGGNPIQLLISTTASITYDLYWFIEQLG